MLKIALEEANHPEDYNNLLELLSPPQDITTIASARECKGKTIGIIGGGLAGMAAAFELRKLGFEITVFESQRSRVGGRVYTYYFDDEKRLYGELGAMRIPVSHETTWHYINLFGLNTRPFIQDNPNAFIYVRNKRVRNDPGGIGVMQEIYPEFELTPGERRTPWQKLLDYALSTPFLNLSVEMRREILEIRQTYSEQFDYLDRFNKRAMMEHMGLSRGAIEVLSCVMPLIGEQYYHSYYESMQEIYTVDTAFRYEVVGGMVQMPHAFYQSLMSRYPKEYVNIEASTIGTVIWKNGRKVTGIYDNGEDEKVTLEYRNERTLQIYRQSFDFVICAIPFSSLRTLEIYPMFRPAKMQAIKEITYIAAQKTLFKCNRRFWEEGNERERIIGGGSYTDLPIASIWYPSDHADTSNFFDNREQSYEQPGVLLASYNLGQDAIRLGNMANEPRFESIKRQVEAVQGLPTGYLNAIVEDFRSIEWDNEKDFYGGFCYVSPQQKSLFSYAMVEPEYDNHVYFAGEHISSTHGWQQGAVHSAMEAANAVAAYCREHSLREQG